MSDSDTNNIADLVKFITKYVADNGGVTFEELVGACDDIRGIASRGDEIIYLPMSDGKIVLWRGVNVAFKTAILMLRDSWMIKFDPCDVAYYVLDGRTLPEYEIVRQIPKSGYKEARWMPVLIRTRR